MIKEKIKKIKIIYYPYKIMKLFIDGVYGCFHYICSLWFIEKNKKRVKRKINNNQILNVIFIIQYIPGWNKLEPVYSKLEQDERFNPIIICIPSNIQNHGMTNIACQNDTYEYFLKQGYKAVNALTFDGKWIDLKKYKPDYIFHSRPYNPFLPLCYMSNRIVKYALICNVMYGVNISVNEQEVTLNKNYFRDVYIYFAYDDNERKFFEKRFSLGCRMKIQNCLAFGAIGIEQVLNNKNKRKRENFKKTVLWTPRWSTDSFVGGSNFFNYKDVLTNLAKLNSEIFFIIRPHPLMFENFINTGEMSKTEVEEFKKKCRNEKNIFLDETKEYTDTFWNSDLLITDLSGMIPEYYSTMHPIIYCNSDCKFNYTVTSKKMLHTCYVVNNKDELIHKFTDLINGNDFKIQDRKKFFDKYFSKACWNSDKIVEKLISI